MNLKTSKQILTSAIIAAISILILNGCPGPSEPTPTPPPERDMTATIDTIWVVGSEQWHTIMVRVNPPTPTYGREMLCQIRSEGLSTHFRLYDDGSLGRWFDAAGFADYISGDQLPDNGVYTRRVNSLFTGHEGEYSFKFGLSDGEPPDSLEIIITLRYNSTPEISELSYPDSIYSGEDSLIFSAIVIDPEGEDDIAFVEVVNLDLQNTVYPMTRLDDSTYVWYNESHIAAGLPTGLHPFVIRAADHYLNQSQDAVSSNTLPIWLENLPPQIIEIAGPDTVELPVEGTKTFEYTIIVSEDQDFSDLDSLLLEIRDSQIVKARIVYFDDGEQPDLVALDGRYHAGFTVADTNKTDVYTFTWTPTDRSPQRGEAVSRTLVFVAPE
ncbi:MAG: hypothetical protein P9X24_14440 [Candidatus Hatepunaea meridiana]|nr:hypothetical protein [Candidatus Hatepunaea meridiana]